MAGGLLTGLLAGAGRGMGGLLRQAPVGDGLLGQAVQQYPALAGLGANVVNTPIKGDFRKLEFWQPDETGDQAYPRPPNLPAGKPGVQIIDPSTSPNDLAADLVSHYMVNEDRNMKPLYQKFVSTFNDPKMMKRLKEDYEYSKKNEQETRPFKDWLVTTRIPDYLRGYMFKQWPAKAYPEMYSKDQMAILDQMSSYLKAKR